MWAVIASVVVLVAAAIGIGYAVAGGGSSQPSGRASGPRGGGVGASGSGLLGTWTLAAYPDGTSVPASSTTTQLSLDSTGMLVAGDGCNSMSGHVDVGGNTLTVGDLATTLIACVAKQGHESDPSVVAAQRFTDTIHRLLVATVHWSVTGDRLTLTKGSDSLTYRRVDTGGVHDPSLLPDTTWQLDTVADAGSDGSASSSSEYAAVTIRFESDSAFVVSYLCVTESGRADVGDGTLTLTTLASRDAKPCSSRANDVDQQVRKRLSGALTWSVVAGQLVIKRAGVGSLTFASVAQSTSAPAPASS